MTKDPHIDMIALSAIRPYKNNPRARPKRQIKLLAESIKANGFNSPIIVDEDGVIINGHGRYLAALELTLDCAPVVRIAHLSEAQKKAYRLADNKIASLSSWNPDLLFGEITAVIEADIDIGSTGFSVGEIDAVLEEHAEAYGPDVAPEDDVPTVAARIVTRPDQMWVLGDHRIICGDAREPPIVQRLMDGDKARMAFTDPPYNVKIDGFVTGSGAVKHEEFAMASGEMSPAEFTNFLEDGLTGVRNVCVDGAIIYVCMDWRHMDELSAAARRSKLSLMNLVVWKKTNGGMGTFYRSQHELIYIYKVGEAPHMNTFGLGEGGRYRTNVWEYRGANAFGPTRAADLAAHPTVKPARLVADAIKDVSKRGDVVLDVFGGLGTTLIAAQMTGRRARLVEIAPAYVDVTIRRWEAATGKSAVDMATGATFEDLSEQFAD
ncbi:MAG: site-specific DNA-methyltransferase [Alphaproteobacteria bacterium]|nr:site-specific DNA-methyltransferase [Alphaproteobacteria bacterium]